MTDDHPDDLGIRIGTKDQALWERVAKETRSTIEAMNESMTIQKAILELAEHNIEIEKEKLK